MSGPPPPPDPQRSDYAPTALPSTGARALAFGAILLAGACGGLIGFAVVDLQCEGDCSVPSGLGALTGALVFAIGVGVVAVLALRAMAEWRVIQLDRDEADSAPRRRQRSDRRG